MKTRIASLAANPEKELEILCNRPDKSGNFFHNPASFRIPDLYPSFMDRRETNVPANETDFSYMENWTIDSYLVSRKQ